LPKQEPYYNEKDNYNITDILSILHNNE
jgi:hypothetical protein